MFRHHHSGIVRSLYQDICQNPLDNTPRLILADWLDENGDDWEQGFSREWLRPQLQSPRPKRAECGSRPERQWFRQGRFGLEQRLGMEVIARTRGRFAAKKLVNGHLVFYGFRRGFPAALEWSYSPLSIGLRVFPRAIQGLPIEDIKIRLTRSLYAKSYSLSFPWSESKAVGLDTLLGNVSVAGIPKRMRAISKQVLAWAREQNRKDGVW